MGRSVNCLPCFSRALAGPAGEKWWENRASAGQGDSTPELVVCFLPHRNQVLVAARRRSQISSASPSLGHPTLGVCPAGGGAALAMIGGEIRVRGSRNRPRPAPGGPRR